MSCDMSDVTAPLQFLQAIQIRADHKLNTWSTMQLCFETGLSGLVVNLRL
jgi:hypothetical protein